MKTNFMVYIAGDNNLDDAATNDILEIKSVKYTGEDLNILIQRDYREESKNSKRFVIKNGSVTHELELGETDTGESQTLTEFLNWGLKSYKAQRNILVIWNHGGGTLDESIPLEDGTVLSPRRGNLFSKTTHLKRLEVLKITEDEDRRKAIANDDAAGNYLDNIEIKDVFENIDNSIAKKFDIIGFDACLMSMIEVQYQLKSYTKIIVGSEELEPNNGWDYARIVSYLVKNPNATNEEVVNEIITSYFDFYHLIREELTLASIYTDKLEETICLMDFLAHTLLRKKENIRHEIWSLFENIQIFKYENWYKDLYHFVLKIEEIFSSDNDIVKACNELKNNLDNEVILINRTESPRLKNAYGISCYLPTEDDRSFLALEIFSLLDINQVDGAPNWFKFFKQIATIDSFPSDVYNTLPRKPCKISNSYIKKGDSGEVVFKIQKDLNMLNILDEELVVDGIFGTQTEKAVVYFQKKYNLMVDGIIGNQTLEKIKELILLLQR